MRKFIQNKLKEQKGLTLIELLAVIVILAIIAAIAIPAIGNIIDNSRVGAIKSDAQNALAAAELLLIDNPKFLDSNNKIELEDLVKADNGYLDDPGSFAGLSGTGFQIARPNGALELTAIGKIGSVEVEFVNADKSEINGLPNNTPQRGAGASTSGVTVKAR